MFKGGNFSLCYKLLLFLSQFLVLAQSLYAQDDFQIAFGQATMALPGYGIASIGSWEEYKRIRQGGAVTGTDADATESGGATVVESPNEETLAEKHVPQATQLPSPPPQRPTTAPRATPAPQVDAVPVTTHAPAPQVIPAPRLNVNSSKPPLGRPAPNQITAPSKPTVQGDWWVYYAGEMKIHANPYYDPHGIDFRWAYARKDPLPRNPRIVVDMHGSGGGEGGMEVFGPMDAADIELRNQDAEAYSGDWREWWTFGANGLPYPGRRIVATLEFLVKRYQIDPNKRGIVLEGHSMGGTGAVIQTMILPDPWRARIAYSFGMVGAVMPRQIAKRDPGQYATLPPDTPENKALWDSIDFSIQAASDPIVRGIHYRHFFSTGDQFSEGLRGSTQLEFVNLIEKNKIGGAFVWINAGHDIGEVGVNLPNLSVFENNEQDVTLDRAHPAITNSTGNFPLRALGRINEKKFPRGHYNMGITWDHGNIVDDATQLVFPLKYIHRTALGKGLPDQPRRITISVTPRRPHKFAIRNGETLKWTWDEGALSGEAFVSGDTVTIDAIPLVSGDGYKKLRIFR